MAPSVDANGKIESDRSGRIASIDVVRGLVMALMALDHVRDYFSHTPVGSVGSAHTTPGLFFTRWITHFCAPAFFLLAGIGVYLSFARGKDRGTLSRRLLMRGALLILLDLTVVRVGWDFEFAFAGGAWCIVLTALGLSMIVLAGLIHLPIPAILAFSVVVIAGHNLLDRFDTAHLGPWKPWWTILHVRRSTTLAGMPLYISYPLLPWVGVMSLGFGLGPMFRWDEPVRRRGLFLLGAAMTVAFVTLRALGHYGDPQPWAFDFDGVQDFLEFLETEKYPASLLYLLMTVGPILMLLAGLDSASGRWADSISRFGRTPLFFYVLHLYVIHALAVVAGIWQGFDSAEMCVVYTRLPHGYGFGLPVIYAVWLGVLAVCYPVCVGFDAWKRRRRSAWASYF